MPVIIGVPTPEEQDRSRRFQVHKNYIGGIAQFLGAEYGPPGRPMLASIIERQRSARGYRRIQRRDVDDERLSGYLNLAWASELQFRLPELADPRLLQYSNAWAPIHAYYSVYMAAQAWFTCLGAAELVDNHTGSLNTLSNQITQRSLFPVPWSVTCAGCPHIGETTFSGAPAGVDLHQEVELLSSPWLETFWPRYGKLLETTRKRRLDRNYEEWKRANGRKRMHKQEKRAVASNLVATTLFDFFWRLRIRSNYRDVRSFLSSGVTLDWHEEFRDSLEVVMEATLLTLESLVVAYAGLEAYGRISREFTRAQRSDLPELSGPLETRLEILGGT